MFSWKSLRVCILSGISVTAFAYLLESKPRGPYLLNLIVLTIADLGNSLTATIISVSGTFLALTQDGWVMFFVVFFLICMETTTICSLCWLKFLKFIAELYLFILIASNIVKLSGRASQFQLSVILFCRKGR